MIIEDIYVPSAGYSLHYLAENLADHLYRKVMLAGIHPGHCALVYDDGAANNLFPLSEGGFKTFLELLNSSLIRLPVKGQAAHMLQVTRDTKESLHYSKNSPNTTSVLPLVASLHSLPFIPVEETAEYLSLIHI